MRRHRRTSCPSESQVNVRTNSAGTALHQRGRDDHEQDKPGAGIEERDREDPERQQRVGDEMAEIGHHPEPE